MTALQSTFAGVLEPKLGVAYRARTVIVRVENSLSQSTKSTWHCLNTRCKFLLHRAVAAYIAAEVLEASDVS